MPGVIPDEGELQMLAIATGVAAVEALAVRLYTNDKVPALADTVADYTEMAAHGYTPTLVPAGAWTGAPAQPGTNTPAIARAAVQEFTFPDSTGPPSDVYGYFLEGVDSGRLWGAERFGDGPYRVLGTPGDLVQVTPTLKLRSGYP
jgi:hypothetical protein